MAKTIHQQLNNVPERDLPFPKWGVKLNMDVKHENFQIMYDLLEGSGLKYWLMFGTMLAAVRDGDFIPGDGDTDIGIFRSEKDKFIELMKAAKEKGFEFIRSEADDALISLMRNGEYFDFYLWIDCGEYFCCSDWRLAKCYFQNLEPIMFLGKICPIPAFAHQLLERLYGKWRIPAKTKATPYETYGVGRTFHE